MLVQRMAHATLAVAVLAAAGCGSMPSGHAVPADHRLTTQSGGTSGGGGGTGGGGGGTSGGGGQFGGSTLRGRVVGDAATFPHISGNFTYSVSAAGLRQVSGSVVQLPVGAFTNNDVIEAVDKTTNQVVNSGQVINNANSQCSPAPCAGFVAEGVSPNVVFGPGGYGPVVTAGDVLDLYQVDPAFIASLGGILYYPFGPLAVNGGPEPYTQHIGIVQF